MAGEVQYEFHRDDAINANKLAYHASLKSLKPYLRIGVLAIVVASGAWLLADGEDPSTRLWFGFGGILYVAGLFVVIIVLNLILAPRRAGKLFDQERLQRSPITMRWGDDGLTFQSATANGTYRWADVYRWRYGRGLFVFFLNDQLYHLVPVRAMTVDQATDLERMARDRLGPPGGVVAATSDDA